MSNVCVVSNNSEERPQLHLSVARRGAVAGESFGLADGVGVDDPEAAVVLGAGEERAGSLDPCASAIVEEPGARRVGDAGGEDEVAARVEAVVEGVDRGDLVA